MNCLRGWVGMLSGVGLNSQECSTCKCRACKESVEHVLFKCASYDSSKHFWDCLKMHLKISFMVVFSIKLCFV